MCALQYVTLNLDRRSLQPTNNTVVSYNILGMADSDTLPAWRLTSKNSSAGVLSGFVALANSACRGLMSNITAIDQLKVVAFHVHAPFQKIPWMRAVQKLAWDAHAGSCEGL